MLFGEVCNNRSTDYRSEITSPHDADTRKARMRIPLQRYLALRGDESDGR